MTYPYRFLEKSWEYFYTVGTTYVLWRYPLYYQVIPTAKSDTVTVSDGWLHGERLTVDNVTEKGNTINDSWPLK